MERGTARRPVLALAAVTMVAAVVSLVGGSHMEVQLVGVGLALMLLAALFRARGMVPAWSATSGSGLPTREICHR